MELKLSHFSYVNDKLPKEQPNRLFIQLFLWPALYIVAFLLLPLTLGLALMSHEKKRINIKKPETKNVYNAALLGIGLLITPAWTSGMIGAETTNPEPEIKQTQEKRQEETKPAVKVVTETKEEEIKYDTEERKDNTLTEGEERTKREGRKGAKTYTYEVTYTDGEETNRELLGKEITQEPVSKVIVIGTKQPEPVSQPSPEPATSPGVVKMSNSDICHAPGTTYYDRTTNYTSFNTMDECLAAGGRRPRR